MKKKVLIISSILLICTILHSCFPTDYYRIIDIEFEAKGEPDLNKIPYVNENLQFIITPKLELERAAQNYIPTMVNSCYATSRGSALENSLVEESFSLSFSKPFTYNGELIPANTNIFDNESIRKEIKIEYPNNTSIYDPTYIKFSELFFQNSTFEEGLSEVTFSCETSDEKSFSKVTSVLVK